MIRISDMLSNVSFPDEFEDWSIEMYCHRGLSILMNLVSDDFFDIEEFDPTDFNTVGLFCEIPYISGGANMLLNNSVFIASVFKITGEKSRYCPISIIFKRTSDSVYSIEIHINEESGTRRFLLLSVNGTEVTSQLPVIKGVTLSKLLGILNIK